MTDKWDWIIKKVSAKWKLDWRLVKAVVEQESGGRPEVESHCGAVGLMQLMPATAEELGCPSKDRTDPEKNLEAGCRTGAIIVCAPFVYVAELHNIFTCAAGTLNRTDNIG